MEAVTRAVTGLMTGAKLINIIEYLSALVGVDDVDGFGIAAHTGVSTSAAFTITCCVMFRARCCCRTLSSSNTCNLNRGSNYSRVRVTENVYAKVLE